MSNTKLTNVQAVVKQYDNSIDKINNKLKSIQSQKSRLKKQKERQDYDQLMTKVLSEEQLLKEAKAYLEPAKTHVTTMSQSDIDILTYDETIRAIKSIQSKKCLIQFDPDSKSEYEQVLVIEQMLKEHKSNVKEHSPNLVKKSKINDLIHHLQTQQAKIDKEYIVGLLEKLMSEE